MANGYTEEWYAARQAKAARRHASVHLLAPVATPERQAPHCGGVVVYTDHKPKRSQDEDDLQILVAEALDRGLPQKLRWMHIPNGGARNAAVGGKLKAMGVKKGAADVLILGYDPFIWIELKTLTGRLSEDQEDWRDWCRSIGAPWFLCRSLDDVIEALGSLQIRLRVRA